jgi:two-component system sensor histidine kinase/response regulator
MQLSSPSRGEIVTGATVEATFGEGMQMHFTVRDTAIGIANEKQGLILDTFTQADGTTRRKFGGTGLGLTISRRLAEAMQGRIWLESTPDEGSCFHFTASIGVTGQRARRHTGEEPSLAGKRALIVDDSASSRHILTDIMGLWNMLPTSVARPEEALPYMACAAEMGHPSTLS